MPECLNPELRKIAENFLGGELKPEEEEQLLLFQQKMQKQSPQTPDPVEQIQQTIAQWQKQASSNMRGLLESIQARSSQALQVQETEEQAIMKLLEESENLAQLRPAALRPPASGVQASSQIVLQQIAEHLSTLAKREVEACFQQYFGPLTKQLQEVVNLYQKQLATGKEASPSEAENTVHTTQTDTSM